MAPAEAELEPILFVPRLVLESDHLAFRKKTASQHSFLQNLLFLKLPGCSQGMDALTVTHIVVLKAEAMPAAPVPRLHMYLLS